MAREAGEATPGAAPAPRATSGRLLGSDRLATGVRISVELAPLHVPRREEVVASVRTLLRLGPDARAGRVIDGTRWRYDPDGIEEQAERAVRTLPDEYTGAAGTPRLREIAEPSLPFTVFLGEHRAALCIDHRLGDGFLAVLLTAATLRGGPVPAVLASARDGSPLRTALGATFLRHGGRTRDVVRARLADHRPEYSGPTAPGARGSLDLVTSIMDADTFRGFAAWSKGRVPPSLAMLFALRAALHRVGIPVMDEGSILVDLRRYLPSGRSTLANFVVGHPIPLTEDLDEAGARFTHDLHVARPLAALTLGLMSHPWNPATEARVPAHARPIVSDMGFLRSLEPLPWSSDSPTVTVSVDPAGRNGITALTAVLRRRMNVSFSFDGSLYPRDAVSEAATLLCRDPKGLLT
ncbi:hypothetical protein [Microbacterium sp.]|uniref:hypothetical protein n=1 Tax=Microbacterium sp. TaxID=51671 RepID=UPI003C755164